MGFTRGGTPGTIRRRRRLPPMFREAFKELGELLVKYHGSRDPVAFERALIIWWMRWFVVEERTVQVGEPKADKAREDPVQTSLYEEATDEVDCSDGDPWVGRDGPPDVDPRGSGERRESDPGIMRGPYRRGALVGRPDRNDR